MTSASETIENELSAVRNLFAMLLRDAYGPQDFYVSRCIEKLHDFRQVLEKAALQKELVVVCNEFQSREGVLAAFMGEVMPTLRYVWILEGEARLFLDVSWRNYLEHIDRYAQDGIIGGVKALLIADELTIGQSPRIQALLQYYSSASKMTYRIVSPEVYRISIAEAHGIDRSYLDFAVYGSRLVFRTRTYDGETRGPFSKDPGVINAYTEFFDLMWTHSPTIILDEQHQNLLFDQLLRIDAEVDE